MKRLSLKVVVFSFRVLRPIRPYVSSTSLGSRLPKDLDSTSRVSVGVKSTSTNTQYPGTDATTTPTMLRRENKKEK